MTALVENAGRNAVTPSGRASGEAVVAVSTSSTRQNRKIEINKNLNPKGLREKAGGLTFSPSKEGGFLGKDGVDISFPLKREEKDGSWFVPVLFPVCSSFPFCSSPDKENRS